MSMLVIGIMWIFIGIVELLGKPMKISAKYLKQPWTAKYIRQSGIGWLLCGVPWVGLYFILMSFERRLWLDLVLMLVFAVPSIIYQALLDRKYDKLLGKGNTK